MERRKTRPGEAARIALQQAIALRFKRFGDFSDALSANISTGGMFVRAPSPHPVGSVFEFELRLSDEAPPIAGKAQVAWVRRRSDNADEPIGMGVRFVELADDSRRQIARLVADPKAGGGPAVETETAATKAAATDARVDQGPVPVAAAPRSRARKTPAKKRPAKKPPPADNGAERRPRWPLWIMLVIVLTAALAAAVWLRPPPPRLPATIPSAAETTAVDSPSIATTPPTDDVATTPEQLRMVEDWASSWSEQRVENYLAAYSPNFKPPAGLDRAAWERQRRARILAPRWIDVGLAFVEIEETGTDRSRVHFVQAYESDGYRDVVRKVLDLERREDGWKILSESVEP